MSDLTTKAAEIRAGLVERLRDDRHCNDWYLRQEAAALIEQQAAELADEKGARETAERGGELILADLEQAKAELAEARREKEAAISVAEMNATSGAFWAERGRNAEAERDELLREKERLGKEVEAVRLIVDNDVRLMDPPDGGDPKPAEKVANLRRMFEAAEQSLVKIKEAGKELYKWTLVIESAMHHGAPRDHPKVVAAIKQLFSALENGPAGLADANSKSPAPSSQSERIAVLEAALRKKDEALKPFADQSKHFDEGAVRMGFAPSFDEYRPAVSFTHGELRAARRAYDALPAALAPLGEE